MLEPTSLKTGRPLGVGLLLTVCLIAGMWNWQISQAANLHDDDEGEAVGIVQSMPENGLIGDWIIDDVTYRTTDDSEIEADDGPLIVGACVEVKFRTSTPPFIVEELKTEDSKKCNARETETPDKTETPDGTETPEPDDTPDDDATPDAKNEIKGLVQSLPERGLLGTWLIEGVEYLANESTEFEQEEGPFVEGACVEVEFFPSSTPPIIHEIETEELEDCEEAQGEERTVFGRIQSFPEGLIGEWIVNDVTYVTTVSTEFEEEEGAFAAGVCVEIEFRDGSSPFKAKEIETEEAEKCNGSSMTPEPTDTSTPDPNETPTPATAVTPEAKQIGRIDSFPTDLVGEWVIDGQSYIANTNTEFEEEHGRFDEGVCVEVQWLAMGQERLAREIETEKEHECTEEGETAEGELFGLIQSFPEELLGEWNIGGMTFVADSNTEFKQEKGEFAIGATVKVEFFIGQDGLNYAKEIKTKFKSDDGGDDDDDGDDDENDRHDRKGKAFGPIENFPSSLIGSWIIGGNEYIATDRTEFEQEDGQFAEGVQVKVKYYLNSQDQRIAKEIKTTDDDGGASQTDHFKFFGFVDEMPPSGFKGQWTIDQIAFITDSKAQFEEENGLLAVGAYVEVEYLVRGGRNWIHEIETHVPPGAGEHDVIGTLQSINPVAVSSGGSLVTWLIDNKTYTVLTATDLNEQNGAFVVGATVSVNSYTAKDGHEIATRIETVHLVNTVYLPITLR